MCVHRVRTPDNVVVLHHIYPPFEIREVVLCYTVYIILTSSVLVILRVIPTLTGQSIWHRVGFSGDIDNLK